MRSTSFSPTARVAARRRRRRHAEIALLARVDGVVAASGGRDRHRQREAAAAGELQVEALGSSDAALFDGGALGISGGVGVNFREVFAGA